MNAIPPATPPSIPARLAGAMGPRASRAIVLAGGVLVGAINLYLPASLLPTAAAELGEASFYAWTMTVYIVAMVVTTMLTGRFLTRWGNVGAYLAGCARSGHCCSPPASSFKGCSSVRTRQSSW
ncbi:hypothetical protein AB0K12_23855 [Nonomuraea sp. NPDC049419]|uniref:hypothetical protein n=1 Tax=Nonomuraea sp. NPDC049419 TaxID=3155772 RepID=UPI00342ADE93